VGIQESVRPPLSQLSRFALALAFFYPLLECMATSLRVADHSHDVSLRVECDATGHERLWSLPLFLTF